MNLLRLLVVSALPLGAFGFVSLPSPTSPLRDSIFCNNKPLLPPSSLSIGIGITNGAFFSNATDEDAKADAVLREFEKKEAKIARQREEAAAKLSKYEAEFRSLQTQKQEYLNGVTLQKTPPGGNFKESLQRSLVKSIMWRIVAGSVTFVTSYRFSGSITTALTIVGSDFFSKAATMFIGERLMNKSGAGRESGSDGVGRSLVKALIWRLFAIANTLTMAFFIAKDLSMASKIAGSDAIFKTGLMFFYERIWAKIQWGKEYEIEFSI